MRLPQVQTDFQRLTSRGLQTDYYKNCTPIYAKKCKFKLQHRVSFFREIIRKIFYFVNQIFAC